MAGLGSFTAAAREYDRDGAEPDTIDFYGEQFTVVGHVPAILELKLSVALAGKLSGIEQDATVWEVLRYALTAPEREVEGKKILADASAWDRFYQVALAQDAPAELLTGVTLTIMGAQVGRPTVRRSTSDSGSPSTSTSSNSSASGTESPDATPAG